MSDQFYRAFEEKFRGSRALIQQRLEVYLPFVNLIREENVNAKVVDLGCGRGEWLELLKNNGITASGVDLDTGMLDACRGMQLEVSRQDALVYLKSLKDGSVGVVTAFHLVEHLPFEILKEVVSESLRALIPGGLLIMETPNPENLIVATKDFYLDPTHQRPLPPELLAFVPEYYGYETVRVLRLQADTKLKNQRLTVRDLLSGSSQDFAVVAQKKIESDLNKRFLQFFEKPVGVSADELFALHVHQSRESYQGVKESIDRSISINERLEKIENALPSQYQGVVGWVLLQVFKVAEQGFLSRLHAFRQKVQRKIIYALLSFVDSKPKLRRACVHFVKATGMYSFVMRRVPTDFSGLSFPTKKASNSQYSVDGFSKQTGEIAARLQQKKIPKD